MGTKLKYSWKQRRKHKHKSIFHTVCTNFEDKHSNVKPFSLISFRFKLCDTILWPGKMCQSHLSLQISHWVHEQILMSPFLWLVQRKCHRAFCTLNMAPANEPCKGEAWGLNAKWKKLVPVAYNNLLILPIKMGCRNIISVHISVRKNNNMPQMNITTKAQYFQRRSQPPLSCKHKWK